MNKIKENLKEQLEDKKYDCSDKCYEVISDIIEYYDFETEDEFRDHIHEAVGEAIIYYSRAFDYLQENNICDFEEAIINGFGYGVCSIATYYLEQEVWNFIGEYMVLSIIDKYAEIKPYLDIELEDDETPDGGISYQGETLFDFLDELGDEHITTLEEVNEALKQNGIKPIEEK